MRNVKRNFSALCLGLASAASQAAPEPQDQDEIDVMSMEDLGDLWDYYACEDFFNGTEVPIPPIDAWASARDIYKTRFLREDIIDAPKPDDSYNGFAVKIVPKQSPGKGRGIFAAQDIKKGDLIWSSKHSGTFNTTGIEYRQFLISLDPAFICNVLQCSSTQKFNIKDGGEQKRINVDLDEGCFVNADYSDSGEFVNMGCDEEGAKRVQGGCEHNDFAVRDIKMGEELLNAYEDFVAGLEYFHVF